MGCTEPVFLGFYPLNLPAWLHSEQFYFCIYSILKDVIIQVEWKLTTLQESSKFKLNTQENGLNRTLSWKITKAYFTFKNI